MIPNTLQDNQYEAEIAEDSATNKTASSNPIRPDPKSCLRTAVSSSAARLCTKRVSIGEGLLKLAVKKPDDQQHVQRRGLKTGVGLQKSRDSYAMSVFAYRCGAEDDPPHTT